jgi:hypothetical protein
LICWDYGEGGKSKPGTVRGGSEKGGERRISFAFGNLGNAKKGEVFPKSKIFLEYQERICDMKRDLRQSSQKGVDVNFDYSDDS